MNFSGVVTSLGASLAELRRLGANDQDPVAFARDLAEGLELSRVLVHADHWSMSVHRGDRSRERDMVLAGNLVAASRARTGTPTPVLSVHSHSTFTDDRPASRALGGGWYVECVPTPHLARPRTTVGLGDSFVAGSILASLIT